MDENWREKFAEVIQERKDKLKIWRGTLILGVILYFVSYVLSALSFSSKSEPESIASWLFFLAFFIVLLIGALYSRKRRYLYTSDILFYNLYELTDFVEKYQKEESQLKKDELKKSIKKLLKESKSLAQLYEKRAERYVYPSFEKEVLSFFNQNIYYFRYAVEHDIFLHQPKLKHFRDNFNAHMKLREKNDTDYLELQRLGLDMWKYTGIPKYETTKENKWLKFFTNRTLIEKVLLYSSINTLIVGAFFYFIVPMFSKENLFSNGVTVWGVFEGTILLIIWSNKSSSGT